MVSFHRNAMLYRNHDSWARITCSRTSINHTRFGTLLARIFWYPSTTSLPLVDPRNINLETHLRINHIADSNVDATSYRTLGGDSTRACIIFRTGIGECTSFRAEIGVILNVTAREGLALVLELQWRVYAGLCGCILCSDS